MEDLGTSFDSGSDRIQPRNKMASRQGGEFMYHPRDVKAWPVT